MEVQRTFLYLKTVLSPWQHVPRNTSHISSKLLHLHPPLVIMLFCHMNVYSDKMQYAEATEWLLMNYPFHTPLQLLHFILHSTLLHFPLITVHMKGSGNSLYLWQAILACFLGPEGEEVEYNRKREASNTIIITIRGTSFHGFSFNGVGVFCDLTVHRLYNMVHLCSGTSRAAYKHHWPGGGGGGR